MVLYFSGTGNSKYVAEETAKISGDKTLSLNDRIKNGDTSPLVNEERIVFVTPTYAWRIPRVVEEYIEKTEFKKGAKAWFIMTCGGEIGDAGKYLKKLCLKKNFEYMGVFGIVMPENYIAMFSVPEKERAEAIVKRTVPEVKTAADYIVKESRFPTPRRNLYDILMSGPVNPVFYKLCVKADAFFATDECISCKKCAAVCPLNNITFKGGKPVWGKNCTHCMACICRCPKEAIEYGKKSKNKPRYCFEKLF